jgi:hypothetical protein
MGACKREVTGARVVRVRFVGVRVLGLRVRVQLLPKWSVCGGKLQ